MGKGAGSGASGRDTLWARHAIFPHERRLKPMKQSLPFVQKDQSESTWRSPKSRSALGYCSRKQIPNPCFMYGRNSEKNRRKKLFSVQFSVNPSDENKSVWQEFSE